MIKDAKSILLVDDDPDVLELMKDILECEGYKVVMAQDGLMGTLKVKNQDFDLIISDLNMPKQDGIKFLNNIVKDKTTYGKKVPPIIIITGEVTPLAKEICTKGKIPLLEKPFSSDTLLVEVEKCFAKKQRSTSPKKSSSNKEVSAKEVVFNVGETIEELFLIKEGEIDIYNQTGKLISTFSAGEIMGTSIAITATPSPIKAVAKTNAILTPIPKERIIAVMKDQPKWFQAIVIKMAKENIKLQNK